jgi:hypothetical protein
MKRKYHSRKRNIKNIHGFGISVVARCFIHSILNTTKKMTRSKTPATSTNGSSGKTCAGYDNSQKGNNMAMSTDRVRFTVPATRIWKESSYRQETTTQRKYRNLLKECFGLTENELPRGGDLVVVCRPSQFARFIVRRYEIDEIQNQFSELKPELIEEYVEREIHVWDRPK